MSSKFGDRIISRKTEHFWPPYSPDLNPLDFLFWCSPNTIDNLKSVVEDFALNFDHEKAFKMARHVKYRAQLCKTVKGGHFEDL